ncbi:hypothetical protein N7492_009626 [Penicillium capsulatum]|uniref:Uncharacterized protein n=1 Tax=Penicillium capsulatum TaxID=69766 RepID=A0A9W9LI27_9EURO|nr:hypothetical protein N7492_009626 [Penicillium capsulatum]KAJ6107012.1 hypothetical protein N7512_010529 [Penicillium capsulatum]
MPPILRRPMPPIDELAPGLSVMRLEGLEDWTTAVKTETLTSIADDMQATLWCISRHLRCGNLNETNTKPIEDMIRIIHGPVIKKSRRMKRKIRRLQKLSNWFRTEQRQLLDEAETMVTIYKATFETLDQNTRGLREELERVKAERDLLQHQVASQDKGANILENHMEKDKIAGGDRHERQVRQA